MQGLTTEPKRIHRTKPNMKNPIETYPFILAGRFVKKHFLKFLSRVRAALLLLFLAGGATASAQVVTNTADSDPGTLRSAVTHADNGAFSLTVTNALDPSVPNLFYLLEAPQSI